MKKREGGYTYFVPDVAYHVAKWERGFSTAINIQGSDHHGTTARVRAGLQALQLGIPNTWPRYILHKMVKVVRGGAEVKVSKRAGSYVTLRELVDWVGQDAVRFFLIQRRADSEFVFDIDLALAKNDENPVYYIQYAHARICSILRQAGVAGNQTEKRETGGQFGKKVLDPIPPTDDDDDQRHQPQQRPDQQTIRGERVGEGVKEFHGRCFDGGNQLRCSVSVTA